MTPRKYAPSITLALLAVAAFCSIGPGEAAEPAAPASAKAKTRPQPPRDTHPRIDDAANILAPYVPRLGRMADAFEKDLGIDLQVMSSLDGATPIETQAVQAFEKRQVSRNSSTGGLLIILDPKLRAARIEVGYSLEGVLTDLQMGRLARDQLAPYVSYGA